MFPLQHIRPENEERYPVLREIDAVLIHRCSVGNNARDVMHGFAGGIPQAARIVGYRMPYHFVVDASGEVTQCVTVGRQAPHAASWNSRSIGVAVLGDFRRNAPTGSQWNAAATLVGLLASPERWDVLGHDEAPGGSNDPRKQCPGRRWPMEQFRSAVWGREVSTAEVDDFWRYVRL